MHKILLVTLVAAIAGVQSLTKPKSSPRAESIGQIGSKEYFEIENGGVKVNWMAARGACASENLEFGSTETSEEFRFLYNERKGNDYWVASAMKGLAEDIFGTSKAFEWVDGSELAAGINFHNPSTLWLCLYFSGDDHTYVDFCLSGEHKILCHQRL